MIELKKAIPEVALRTKSLLNLLDIGIGNARVLMELKRDKDLWGCIARYEGIDVAENCIDISRKAIEAYNAEDKAAVKLLDASKLKSLDRKYDLIISTWFTVGNFYPYNFDFDNFKPGYDMRRNDKFSNIFKQAYDMLNENGEIIIGSMYIDNEATRKKQEDAYRDFGWDIITDGRDCFTATRDGWWSQRFTKQRIYDYLDFIDRGKISFIPLDNYDYAMMARIRK